MAHSLPGTQMSPAAWRQLERLTKHTALELAWLLARERLARTSPEPSEHAVLLVMDRLLEKIDAARRQRPQFLATRYAEEQSRAVQAECLAAQRTKRKR